MVKDADAHAEEDKRKKEEIETRNHLDSLVYNTEKLVRDNKDKIPASDLSAIESAIEDGKKALQSNDLSAMKAAQERIQQASHKMAEAMYRAAGAGAPGGPDAYGAPPPPPPGAGAPGKGSDDVIDAEYEENK